MPKYLRVIKKLADIGKPLHSEAVHKHFGDKIISEMLIIGILEEYTCGDHNGYINYIFLGKNLLKMWKRPC